MRVLHTSDWHIGKTLCGRRRYEEFGAFLDWLAGVIVAEEIETLLVAGDIFDVSAPSNRAQELYYRFLRRVAASPCRHVVIVAGNHDSPSFLNAPKELLKALDVHVAGCASDDPDDDALVLRNGRGDPELIVCAVPYLRERDIRISEPGESVEDKERKLVEGIRLRYAAVGACAERKRAGTAVPVVGMGHLFAVGGQVAEGDGLRELYVGSLAPVGSAIFPASFDYLALGHLHIPQLVGGSETMRYSGSPLPMSFEEAGRPKSVCRVEFEGTLPKIRLIEVPLFQELGSVRGDWEHISKALAELRAAGSKAWLEVLYEGGELMGDLRERLEEAVSGTGLEILRVRNRRALERALAGTREDESLDDLSATEVFERCLAAHEVPARQRPELIRAYQESLDSVYAEQREK